MNAREAAMKILYEVKVNKGYSNILINKVLDQDSFSRLDRAFITELVYGTLENIILLDYIIKQYSKTKLTKINPYTLNILRMGLYQILFLDKVPDFAAVNESVELSKIYSKRATGFVNGILRNISRNKEELKLPDKESDIVKFYSITYSHPQWMVKALLKHYPEDFVEDLLKTNNKRPKLYARVNKLKTSPEELIDILNGEGVGAKKSQYLDEAIIIEGDFTQLKKLSIYKEGFLYVQDLSSILVSKILDPEERDFVIDICSAPGGKTTHIGELMNNKGKILARDIHEHKLRLVRQNAQRLGIENIQLEKFDALKMDKELCQLADKVLVDAPCSGWGVIRRKPEIKYQQGAEEINNLIRMQYQILTNASRYVKKGGYLVYSTCTINPNENQNIIRRFLQHNDDFTIVDVDDKYKGILAGGVQEGMIQLYPHIHATDGFFIAKLMKK